MRKVEIQKQTHLEIDGIEGFFIRKVMKFGNSAKVDCPKDYLGHTENFDQSPRFFIKSAQFPVNLYPLFLSNDYMYRI
jgi:putative transposon-encoded protein